MESSLLRQSVVSMLLLLLAGCSQSDVLQKFASPEDQALARNYIDLLRQRRFEGIEKAADPSIGGPSLHDTLVKMAALIPPGGAHGGHSSRGPSDEHSRLLHGQSDLRVWLLWEVVGDQRRSEKAKWQHHNRGVQRHSSTGLTRGAEQVHA